MMTRNSPGCFQVLFKKHARLAMIGKHQCEEKANRTASCDEYMSIWEMLSIILRIHPVSYQGVG
jgi:hypothetical protein